MKPGGYACSANHCSRPGRRHHVALEVVAAAAQLVEATGASFVRCASRRAVSSCAARLEQRHGLVDGDAHLRDRRVLRDDLAHVPRDRLELARRERRAAAHPAEEGARPSWRACSTMTAAPGNSSATAVASSRISDRR